MGARLTGKDRGATLSMVRDDSSYEGCSDRPRLMVWFGWLTEVVCSIRKTRREKDNTCGDGATLISMMGSGVGGGGRGCTTRHRQANLGHTRSAAVSCPIPFVGRLPTTVSQMRSEHRKRNVSNLQELKGIDPAVLHANAVKELRYQYETLPIAPTIFRPRKRVVFLFRIHLRCVED